MSDVFFGCNYKFNYPKIQDTDNSLEIKPYQVELERCRVDEVKSIIASINEVRGDLEILKTEVYNLQENRTDYLRRKMYDVEGKIRHFKELIKEELFNLLRDEINLSRELQFTERKLEEWGKPVDVKIFRPFKQNSCKVWQTSDNPTVQFQKFLSSSGGHYGGWEEQDHVLFLRERKKLRGKDKFFLAVHLLLPDLSYDQIEEHEKWYQKYEDMRNSQKDAIQKWRAEKEIQHKKEREGTEGGEEKKQIKKTVHQQINIAERIKEWKHQQLLRKLEEEERQKKEKKRLQEGEKRKREMQEMKKLAVNQYKAEKLSRAREILREDERPLAREAKARHNVLLKSFRLQDLQFIEKKKVIRLQIESKANERLERWRLGKPALQLILQRDPQRIFQPTLIWSQHCLETQKRERINPVFDLDSIPRLAVPEWRKELK